MKRVYVIVEGETEEAFINSVLSPYLSAREILLIPRIVGVPGHKGGNTNYARVRGDILIHLKSDRAAFCSTMLDFYGLGKGFPGLPLSKDFPAREKVSRIEQAWKEDIISNSGDNLRAKIRFLPYLQLHEFEALLFSDPAAFASGIRQPHLSQHFQLIRDKFATPEDINDDPNTAPSKQIQGIYADYRKPIHGPLGAQVVGITSMRQQCQHFRGWLEQLESLPKI